MPIIKLKTKVPIPHASDSYWTVERYEPMKNFDTGKLALHLEPEQKDKSIKGDELVERMKGKGLNSHVLDYLLKNPKYIPEEWKTKHVFFWGTIYLDISGSLFVRCLDWDGEEWGWCFYWLGNDFGGSDPAAILANTPNTLTCPHCNKDIKVVLSN